MLRDEPSPGLPDEVGSGVDAGRGSAGLSRLGHVQCDATAASRRRTAAIPSASATCASCARCQARVARTSPRRARHTPSVPPSAGHGEHDRDAPGRAATRERGGAVSGARVPRRCSEYPQAACPAPPRATLLPPRSRHEVLPVLRRTRRPRCAGLPAMRPRPRGARPRAEDYATARASPDRAHPLARRAPDRRRPRGRTPARHGGKGARASRGRAHPARACGTAPLARARTPPARADRAAA